MCFHCSVVELRGAVLCLSEVAQSLRRRRKEAGAVELDSIEVRVQMSGEDKDHRNIESLVPKQVGCI